MTYTEKRLEEELCDLLSDLDNAIFYREKAVGSEIAEHIEKVEDIKKSIRISKQYREKSITQAIVEERERVLDELDDEATWYITTNHIPDSELGKSEEHWEMLNKLVKDSLKDVAMRVRKSVSTSPLITLI